MLTIIQKNFLGFTVMQCPVLPCLKPKWYLFNSKKNDMNQIYFSSSLRLKFKKIFILNLLWILTFNGLQAQITWDGEGGDRQWTTAANWSNDMVPTSSDDVELSVNDRIEISNGASVVAQNVTLLNNGDFTTLFIGENATLTTASVTIFRGNLTGFGTVMGSVTTRNGGSNVTPGDDDEGETGVFTIIGDFTQDNDGGNEFGGSVDILITANNEVSKLIVTGTATLTERITINTRGDYSPELNDKFEVFEAGTLSGMFTEIEPSSWKVLHNDPSTGKVSVEFDPDPPANDDCANAEMIAVFNGRSSYTVAANQGVSPTPPVECHEGGQYDVWYKFMPQSSNPLIIQYFFANSVVLYAGADCENLSTEPVACGESETGNNSNDCPQLVVEGLSPGQMYYIQVITDEPVAELEINLSEANGPANDFCANAITGLTVGAEGSCETITYTSGTTVDATHTSPVSCSNNYQCNFKDVWYTVTTPTSGRVKFIPDNSEVSNDHVMAAVFYSSTCGDLVEEACVTGEGSAFLMPETIYFLKIATYDNQGGEGRAFTFCLEEAPEPPTNNTCNGAEVIPSISPTGNCTSITGTTVNGTSSMSFACAFGGGETYLDAWYSFTAPADGKVTFNAGMGAPFATIYSGTCGDLTAVNNGCMRGTGTVIGLTPDETYYLQVLTSGTSGSVFDFCLELSGAASANDVCGTDLPIIQIGIPVSVNNPYATTSLQPSCAPIPALNIPDEWFTFTAPSNGEIAYIFDGGTVLLSVFEGDCGNLTELTCALPLGGNTNLLTGLTPDATYFAQLISIGVNETATGTLLSTDGFFFNGDSDNLFSNTANWVNGAVPDGSEPIFILSNTTVHLDVDLTLTSTLNLGSGSELVINNGQSLVNNGAITGIGTITNNFINDGVIDPGNSPGCLTFSNDFTNSALGIIDIQIGGITPCTEHDQIVSLGNVDLLGALNVFLVNDFAPAKDDQFVLINGSITSNEFTATNLPEGITWELIYNTNNVTLKALSDPLAVTFISFTGKAEKEYNILNWTATADIADKAFMIEQSTDGKNFSTLGKKEIETDGVGEQRYQFIDKHPQQGANYYRIKAVNSDGSFTYSPTRLVTSDAINSIFKVFPNPVKDGILNVDFSVKPVDIADVQIYNLAGQLVYNKTLNNLTTDYKTLNISQLETGVYLIHIQVGTENYWEKVVVD